MALCLERIRHLLIDLDGVLYTGTTPLPHAAAFIAWLRARAMPFRLVTNNATLTPAQYVDKLAAMAIEVHTAEVFTSALATAAYLEMEGARGQAAYAIGEVGLLEALADIGMRITAEHPQWVVTGLDRSLTYEKLATAALAVRAGARFIGTNPDTSLPTERGLLPGAGAIQAAIIAATGVTPTVIGKPQPLMLRLAMQSTGGSAQDTAMLGDRLDTDIAGAATAGLPSILVLTGVSTRAEAARGPAQPDLIVDDLAALMRQWPASR